MQTAADFQLTIDKIYEPDESYPGVDYIRVDYTIKNVSGKTVPPYGLKGALAGKGCRRCLLPSIL